jgi:hypothetical protein
VFEHQLAAPADEQAVQLIELAGRFRGAGKIWRCANLGESGSGGDHAQGRDDDK